MIYVHCSAPSEGANLLAETLRDKGFRAIRSRNVEKLHNRLNFRNDTIIGWGELVPFDGVRVLNGKPSRNKLEELGALQEKGVPVPPFDTMNWGEGWLGRSLHHQEGNDFLSQGAPRAAFWTRKLEIEREFRFHIFKLPEGFMSIRGGEKLPRTANPHPWVRSYNHGWRMSYGKDLKGAGKCREASKKALEALGYDFGAVDVGLLKGGEPVVLEVNSRIGMDEEGQTVVKYAEAIGKVVMA